jgi:MoxR-like ATPase
VIDAATLAAMQAGIERVYVEPDIARYCVDIAAATRRHKAIEVGSSPRGSQGLMLVARALAVIAGRDFVVPEDIKRVTVPVLAHRLSLTTQAWADGTRTADVVAGIVADVAGPPAVGARSAAAPQ